MTNYLHNYTHRLRASSEHKSNIFLLVTLAGFLFAATSCEEAPSLIGGNLLPGSDFVTIESRLLGVKAYTMYTDSTESDMPSVSYLGKLFDPYFGSTEAMFVTQLRLGNVWNFDYYEIDSIKLYLKFLNVTGNVEDAHYLRLSEIADVIYDTLPYYSGLPVALTPFTIPDILLPSLKADTINDIVLDVDTTFARRLVSNPEMLFHSNDTDDFRTYFRGLRFKLISPDDPIFISLSVAATSVSSYSNFFVLYMSDAYNVPIEFAFRLDALTANASFNIFEHNREDADDDKELYHVNDQNYLDTLAYSQVFNGVYTKLILTSLDSIKNDPEMKNISVNRARLKIPVVYDNDRYKRATIPSILYLRYLTTTGEKLLVPETGTAVYNGSPDTTYTSQADDVYNLNIASFVQEYLEDSSNKILPQLELFLIPSAGNNVILKANGSYKPIKFEFTYTKF